MLRDVNLHSVPVCRAAALHNLEALDEHSAALDLQIMPGGLISDE